MIEDTLVFIGEGLGSLALVVLGVAGIWYDQRESKKDVNVLINETEVNK